MWNVGDGRTARFSDDTRIGELGPIRSLAHELGDQMEEAKVCDMVDIHGEWDWGNFGQFLEPNILLRIGSIPAPTISTRTDTICWNDRSLGLFTIQDVYGRLVGVSNSAMRWQ